MIVMRYDIVVVTVVYVYEALNNSAANIVIFTTDVRCIGSQNTY